MILYLKEIFNKNSYIKFKSYDVQNLKDCCNSLKLADDNTTTLDWAKITVYCSY